MAIINRVTQKYDCFKKLMFLALPVLIGELGHMLAGIVDAAVISRYSTDSLEAICIANSVLYTIFIFGLGIQNAISINLSKKRGENENTKDYFISTVVYSVILSIVFTFICLGLIPFIDKMGFEPKLYDDMRKYIFITAFSMPGLFIYQGMKEFLQSLEIVTIPNIILLASVILNLFLNFLFIFGYGIIPSMGVEGAALTTLFVRSIIAPAIIIYTVILFKHKMKFNFGYKLDFDYMKQCTILGFPIGAAWMLEFLAFNLVTVLVGRVDGTLSATHSILTNISAITFAFPASVAIALCIKVAYHFGANEPDRVKQYFKTALLSGVGFMILMSVILFVFPKQILRIYTEDTEIIQFAIPVISMLIMYQIFDGFQTVTGGLLKGFKKTGTVSVSVIASYWLVGAPIAYYGVSVLNIGLRGYWFALAFSLCTMGFIQVLFARKLLRMTDYSSIK